MSAPPEPPRDDPETHDLPWYSRAFEAGYLNLYAHRDAADAARALDFLAAAVPLRPGLRLLDLCCGAGRHLALIAPRVASAAGLDLSRVLLNCARQSLAPGDPAPLMEADMRALPLRSAHFDAVINLFTRFGYFDRDDENAAVLREIARVLRPGGRFVFDHINPPHLRAGLRPRTERDLDGGVRVLESRRIDPAARRVHKDVEFRRPGEPPVRWHESVRLYEPDELDAAFAAAGLRVLDRFGDFDRRPLTPDAPRLILLAQRP
jgi:SAM-dependent methyltransferase